MPTLNYSVSVAGAGGAISSTVGRTANNVHLAQVPLPVGQAGTLSTRTNNTAGICTIAGLTGLANTNVIDIYYANGVSYGGVITNTSANTVTFDACTGALPVVNTAVVVT